MDSQQMWEDFLDRVEADKLEEAADIAERLYPSLTIFEKAPQISLFHRLPELFSRCVVRAACETILEQANREFS
jgi:hypothetical protein